MITNPILRDEYARRRNNALELAAERTRATYIMLPRLEEIENERMELAFNLAGQLRKSENKSATINAAEARFAALKHEKQRLLADNGLPPDYLEAEFVCAKCEDTGYIGDEKHMCSCLRERLMALNYASSGLNPAATFEGYSTSIVKDAQQKRQLQKACAICEEYANALEYNGAKGLLLAGAPGLGKTFLLDCVGQRAIKNGASIQKFTSYNIINDALARIKARQAARDYSICDLLIIDDLGSEPSIPNITFETLFSIINERQNAMRATAIATNLSTADILDTYGERLFSRLVSPALFSVLLLEGNDLRLK